MKKYIFGGILSSLFLCSACYYDVESELYPQSQNQPCDTLQIGFHARIEPIIKNNCVSCHGGTGASGNVVLDNYEAVKQAAISRNLYGTVAHTSDKPMPLGGNKLPECDINAIERWINGGYPH